MLWNVVFDFYVRYIFGGVDSTGTYFSGYIGQVNVFENGQYVETTESFTDDLFINFMSENKNTYSMPIGNYLSLIATIISMVAIVLICCALIKKIYNMCAHIIG